MFILKHIIIENFSQQKDRCENYRKKQCKTISYVSILCAISYFSLFSLLLQPKF